MRRAPFDSSAQVVLLLLVLGCRQERQGRQSPAPSPALPSVPPVELADEARRPAPLSQLRRVIWCGLDGADWEYLNSLAAQEKMPNWKRLSAEGFGARLESFVPILSPIIWTTQETGVGPDVHRVLDFQEVDPKTGLLVPVSEASRKVPAIWNIASESGRKVGVVGFWATHPAEKVNGFFLSNRIDPASPAPASNGVGYPQSLDQTVRRVVARDGVVGVSDLTPYFDIPQAEIASALARGAGFDDPVTALSGVLASTRVTQRLSRELYDRELPDLMALYFEGTDTIGHIFAPYAPPRLGCVSEALFEKFHRVAETYFRSVDAILGQWMRRAREDHAILVITSDHGFRWGTDRPCDRGSTEEATAATWHRPAGVFLAWGEGIAPAPPLRAASEFDVAPTLLALLDLPVDRRMRGMVIPVLSGLAVKERRDLFSRISVSTVSSEPLDAKEASEYARKLVALGYIAGSSGRPGAATAASSAGLTKGAWNNLGIYLRFSVHDDLGARAAWEEALRLDPAYHSPILNIARLEKERGHLAEASEWLLRAIAAGQPDAENIVERWAGDFQKSRPQAAIELLRHAHAAYPASETYARGYALLLSGSNRCREALEVAAPLETSSRPESLNAAAVVEACLDRPDRVRDLLSRSLAINPNQPRVREAISSLPPGGAGRSKIQDSESRFKN
jgi:predicted AlkP superfamily phosphohydrolase/phosphomutase